MNNQQPYQYKYDRIGNLVQNTTDGIADIEWNIYGKVEKVTKTPDPFGIQATVEYRYDGTGNRIMKKITAGATSTTTTYLRDASGNVMAIYEEKTDQTLTVKEIPIYGGSRLGQYRPKTDTKKTALGQRIYEFSNHLGNVLVTLSDHKVPQTDGTYESVVLSASDYYPFGMAMKERTYSNGSYRYGFNGKENDTDFGSHIQDYGFRLYCPENARFLSVDPLTKDYPELTTYQFASNTPIQAVDLDGLEAKYVTLYLEKMDDGSHTVSSTEVTIYQNVQVLKDGEKHAATYVTYVVDGESYKGETLYEKITENGMTPSAAYDYTKSVIEGKFTDDWAYMLSLNGTIVDLYQRDINAPDNRRTIEDLGVLTVATRSKVVPLTPKTTTDTKLNVSNSSNTNRKTVKEQALEIKDKLNNGKYSVTIKTTKGQTRYDLDGKAHAGVPTPHTQKYKNNVVNGKVRSVTREKKTADPMNQEDIRNVKKYLKKQ